MFKISIVSGSQRRDSQSGKVALVIRSLIEQIGGIETYLLDLGKEPLALWTDDPAVLEAQDRVWLPIAAHLRDSALVFVTPDWNGMSPPALKNFFLYCTRNEIADHAALLVGVSSGAGGVASTAELRMSSYKDTRVCYIPEQVIVRNVRDVLNSPAAESELDAYTRFRLEYALKVLVEYGKALTEVRRCNVRNFELVPYGM
jgi:NAD(P)H-dependent FMN reductase